LRHVGIGELKLGYWPLHLWCHNGPSRFERREIDVLHDRSATAAATASRARATRGAEHLIGPQSRPHDHDDHDGPVDGGRRHHPAPETLSGAWLPDVHVPVWMAHSSIIHHGREELPVSAPRARTTSVVRLPDAAQSIPCDPVA
jgi:hypothetical protein